MIDTIVKRLNISPYQDSEYSYWENTMVSNLGGSYLSVNEDFNPIKGKFYTLLSNTHTNWDKIPTKVLDKTKLIIHPNSGYDNFAVEFIKEKKIPIIIGNPIRSHAVSNYILSCLIRHFSQLPEHKNWDSSRNWNRELLIKKNVLLIGHGHIGRILEKSISPLVSNINIYDPYKDKHLDFNQVLPSTDIVIPVASLNKTSQYIINEDFLGKLPEDFLLINGARGKLIESQALFDTLAQRPKAFAYLDVFEEEPIDFTKYHYLTNIKMTSHIAGCFQELDQTIINFTKKTLIDFHSLEEKEFHSKYQDLLLNNRIIGDNLI